VQIHDELLVECTLTWPDKVAADIKARRWASGLKLTCLWLAEKGIGDNWMDAKKQ